MKRTLGLLGIFWGLGLLLIYLNEAHKLNLKTPYDHLVTEIGVAIMAVGLIHLLDHMALIPQTAKSIERQSRELFEGEVNRVADTIVGNVSARTDNALAGATGKTEEALNQARDRMLQSSREVSEVLQRQVESIKVMEQSSLVSIYHTRSAAADPMHNAIAASKSVKLMGVSLTEFISSDHSPLRRSWADLLKDVGSGSKEVKVLLIDPYCHGAILRSFAESSGKVGSPRLVRDVLDSAYELRRIRNDLGANAGKLQVKLYHVVPTTFLCQLETMTFVQHYHFWNLRMAGCPVPIFQYRKREHGHAGVSMHREMEQHFDFLWQHASTDLDEFLSTHSRGFEWGSHMSGVATVYAHKQRPNVRMREEMKNSERIWIQGITLNKFFSDPELTKTLKTKLSEPGKSTKLRILLLDPDSEQAKYRAYREFRLNSGPELGFAEFAKDHYANSTLAVHGQKTLEMIQKISSVAAGGSSVEVKKYETAPHMFMLIGDNGAFVEQYSYGKVPDQSSEVDADRILGSDMPLIEYRRTLNPAYAGIIEQMRAEDDAELWQLRAQPFALLESHFQYAWEIATAIDVRNLKAAATA